MENITLQMLTQQTEPPFLSIMRPQSQELNTRSYLGSFQLPSTRLFHQSYYLKVVFQLQSNTVSWYLSVVAGAVVQLLFNDLIMSLPCAGAMEFPVVLLLGPYRRKAATRHWVLCQRFLLRICFPSGSWPVLPCCCSEGFQQNWGVSHTMGSAWPLAGMVPVVMQLYNSNNDRDSNKKNNFKVQIRKYTCCSILKPADYSHSTFYGSWPQV